MTQDAYSGAGGAPPAELVPGTPEYDAAVAADRALYSSSPPQGGGGAGGAPGAFAPVDYAGVGGAPVDALAGQGGASLDPVGLSTGHLDHYGGSSMGGAPGYSAQSLAIARQALGQTGAQGASAATPADASSAYGISLPPSDGPLQSGVMGAQVDAGMASPPATQLASSPPPVAAVPAAVPQRRPVMGGMARPRPVELPGEYHGGRYFPDDGPNQIELRRLRGEITDEQARELTKRKAAWDHSTAGLLQQQQRAALSGQREHDEALIPAAEARGQAMEAREALYDEQAENQQAQAREAEERREAYQRNYHAELDKYRLAEQEVANSKIDPNRWWEQRSTGAKIGTRIAAMLGAIGSSILKTPNAAAEMIQRDIDRDIEAQRSNLANKRAGLAAKRGILGVMREQYGDDEQARQAANRFMLARVNSQLQSLEAGALTEEQRAKVAALRADIGNRERVAELGMQAQAQAAADEAARLRLLMLQRGRATPQGVSGSKWDERYVRGYGMAPSAQTARLMQDELFESQTTLSMLDELEAIGKTPWKSLSPAARARAQSLSLSVKHKLAKRVGAGVLGDQETKVFDYYITPPTDATTLDASSMAKLKQLRKNVRRDTATKMRVYKPIPARQVETAKGARYIFMQAPDDKSSRLKTREIE